MYKVAIIGAGQLGSRHLQGVKLSQHNLEIWVSDPSTESLKVAEERYKQVETTVSKTIHFVNDINDLPKKIDIVIIASSSKPRLAICKELLFHSEVKYLVLEKFLFTSLKEYEEAEDIFEQKNLKVWVNCTRRLFDHFDKVNSLIKKDERISMRYTGHEWGMCCNSIHLIDIFMKLCGEIEYSIDFSMVEKKVENSKRTGYIEFYGTEEIITPKGNLLTLSCIHGGVCDNLIVIKNSTNEFIIDESKQSMIINGEEEKIKLLFQSQLTGQLVDSLIQTGNCALTPYIESAYFHKIYLKGLISLYNQATGCEHDSCPIT